MDDIRTLGLSIVVTLVIAAIGYQTLFARKKLAKGQRPQGAHELEVAIRMGSSKEKSEAMREMAKLYASHKDVWTAESYMKLALKVVEEAEGMRSPNLKPVLQDYADLMRKFGRIGQVRELESRLKELPKSR